MLGGSLQDGAVSLAVHQANRASHRLSIVPTQHHADQAAAPPLAPFSLPICAQQQLPRFVFDVGAPS